MFRDTIHDVLDMLGIHGYDYGSDKEGRLSQEVWWETNFWSEITYMTASTTKVRRSLVSTFVRWKEAAHEEIENSDTNEEKTRAWTLLMALDIVTLEDAVHWWTWSRRKVSWNGHISWPSLSLQEGIGTSPCLLRSGADCFASSWVLQPTAHFVARRTVEGTSQRDHSVSRVSRW